MYNYNQKSDGDINDIGKDDWMKPSRVAARAQQVGSEQRRHFKTGHKADSRKRNLDASTERKEETDQKLLQEMLSISLGGSSSRQSQTGSSPDHVGEQYVEHSYRYNPYAIAGGMGTQPEDGPGAAIGTAPQAQQSNGGATGPPRSPKFVPSAHREDRRSPDPALKNRSTGLLPLYELGRNQPNPHNLELQASRLPRVAQDADSEAVDFELLQQKFQASQQQIEQIDQT